MTTGLTVATWIRPEQYATQDLVKKATNGSVNGYELSLATTKTDNTSQRPFFRINQVASGDTYRVSALTEYPIDGTWMHVAATYDGTTIRLYVNGVLETSLTPPPGTVIATNTVPLSLGAQNDNSRWFMGWMDDARVYNRALSLAEIRALPRVSYTISGNAGVAGAVLSYTDGTPQTVTADSSGNYSITVPYYWSGTITPALTGYTFIPANRSYTHIMANQSAQNFTALSNTQSIPLVVGWNLVSFNLHPNDTSITAVLASITGNYDLVYAWNASLASNNWTHYDPAQPVGNTLLTLVELQGFWIRMTAADILEVTGTAPTTNNINLYTAGGGWNLVGYPSATIRTLPDAFSNFGVDDATLMIFAYHAADTIDPWKMYDRLAPSYSNDLTSITAGWGYWVKVSIDETWNVIY